MFLKKFLWFLTVGIVLRPCLSGGKGEFRSFSERGDSQNTQKPVTEVTKQQSTLLGFLYCLQALLTRDGPWFVFNFFFKSDKKKKN